MMISQKLEKSKESLPGGARQRDLSKNAIKKGHGLKTVVSDFLPEVWAQSVRFTLLFFIISYGTTRVKLHAIRLFLAKCTYEVSAGEKKHWTDRLIQRGDFVLLYV